MWSAALRVGGCGRGVGWFAVLWRTFAAPRRLSGRHKWRPYVCGRLIAVSRWLVCGVARGGAIHDARCRNGTCGRSHCVSVDAGGAAVGLRFFVGRFAASPVRAPFMTPGAGTAHVVGRVACRWMRAGRRLIVVLRRLSGRYKWRPYVCGWLIVVLRVVVGGVTRGCRGKGMGMKKRSRTDVAVSVWLLVVAEARLERTTSRL